jgi:predicted RNA-binding protein with PUA-like domain
MRFWLVKEEPANCSFEQFAQTGHVRWDGIRNYQARNNLRAMAAGDPVLWYATGSIKAVVGTARVTRAAYADPTATEGDWSAVDLEAGAAVAEPVTLDTIKQDPALKDCALLKFSRLSVVPLNQPEHERILQLGGGA